jgi:hypothetical protein
MPTQDNQHTAGRLLGAANRWIGVSLVAILCISGLRFCLYIALTYISPLFGGDLRQWNNQFLPGLFSEDNPGSTSSIGLHFVTGALVMVLGCVQLLSVVRARWPRVHHWIGRLYLAMATLTAFGGLGFIALQGTVGAGAMNVGFGLYGILMVIAVVHTIRHARTGRFDSHRAWAIRLFALVIASWLYRLEYGFSNLLELGGRTPDFRGWFDQVMNFFFYLPNLAVAELYLRAQRSSGSIALQMLTLAALVVSCLVVAGGLYTQLP